MPRPNPPRPRQPDAGLRSVARPKQARSQETLYRILEAAEKLIEEKGIADVSVPEIVRRAGSSVGGFYARFRDKNELLRAIEERFFNELDLRVQVLADPERWSEVPIAQVMRACVKELVGTFRERHALIGAFLARAAQDPDFMAEGLRFRRQVSRRILALLMTRREEIGHPDPEVAIDLCVHFAFGLMNQAVVFGEIRAGSRRLTDRDLERELERAFLAYLGVDGRAHAERSRA